MSQWTDLLMPKLGLTMTEGMLIEWSVASGDQVKAGDPLFVVETDKVANDILAQADGTIGEILVAAGDTVPVGAVVARWTGPGVEMDEMDGGRAPAGGVSEAASAGAMAAPTAAYASTSTPEATPAKAAMPASESRPALASTTMADGRVVATPLARRLAREAGLDLAGIGGTGPGGRIKASDVRTATGGRMTPAPASAAGCAPASASAQAPSQAPASASVQAPASVQAQPPGVAAPTGGRRSEASALVQSMARRMTQAKQVPHFYLSAEAEVSQLLALRTRLNAQPDAPRLTLNHFVIAAVARALTALPGQNRIWNEDHIVQFDEVDVGVAVSTDRGLMAPVLHGLAGATLDDIALQSDALLGRVRAGKATREDMNGGAISISNAGMFNVTYMTPIINPPQSAILGVGSIRDIFRPDEQGAPVLKREMGLVLAADHRLHDGASGLRFLNLVIELLQDPYRLLRNRTHTLG